MSAPAHSGAAPLLDLTTLIVRPTIEIDGARYELLSPDELSVLDSQRFANWAVRLEELQKAGAHSTDSGQADDQSPEMDELVDRIARKACVGVPEDVFDRLKGVHKISVAEVFTGLLLRGRMRTAGAVATAMGLPAIGEAFFRGSSDSMAARRAPGWRARLSRLFGRT